MLCNSNGTDNNLWLCHVHPLVVVHAPASCGRGLEGDGRSILEVTRRRRRRHAKSSENVLSDFPWNIHTEKCLLTTRLYYTCFRYRLFCPTPASRQTSRWWPDYISPPRWRQPAGAAHARVHVLLQISWKSRPRAACLELGRRDTWTWLTAHWFFVFWYFVCIYIFSCCVC